MRKYIVLIIVIAILAYLFLPSREDCREGEALIRDIIEAGKKRDLNSMVACFSMNYREDYVVTCPVVNSVVKNLFGRFDSFDGNYSDLKV